MTEQASTQVTHCSRMEAACPSFHVSSLRRGGGKREKLIHSSSTPMELPLTQRYWGRGTWSSHAEQVDIFSHSLNPFRNVGQLTSYYFHFQAFIKTQKSLGSLGYIVLTCKVIMEPLHFTGEKGRELPTEGLTIFSPSHFNCKAILSFHHL